MSHNAWSGINLNLLLSFVPGITAPKNIWLHFRFMSGEAFNVCSVSYIFNSTGRYFNFYVSATFCVFLS